MVLECTSTAAVSKAPEMLCSDIIILRQIEFRALVAVVLNENELFVSFIASVITSSNLFLLSKCPCFMRTLSKQLCSLLCPRVLSGRPKGVLGRKVLLLQNVFMYFSQT